MAKVTVEGGEHGAEVMTIDTPSDGSGVARRDVSVAAGAVVEFDVPVGRQVRVRHADVPLSTLPVPDQAPVDAVPPQPPAPIDSPVVPAADAGQTAPTPSGDVATEPTSEAAAEQPAAS